MATIINEGSLSIAGNDMKSRRKGIKSLLLDNSSSSRSTSSTISTQAVLQVVEKLKLQHHQDSTRKSYYSTWRQFNEFFIKLDEKPDNWEDRLILFVGYLVEDNKKSSTIKSYVSAIKPVLREDGIVMNERQIFTVVSHQSL